MTDKKILLAAAQLAAANFMENPAKLPTDQMLDITEPYGLSGDLNDDADVMALYHALDIAAGIAGLQSHTLAELAEMIRNDLRERRGIEVEPVMESEFRRDTPTMQ